MIDAVAVDVADDDVDVVSVIEAVAVDVADDVVDVVSVLDAVADDVVDDDVSVLDAVADDDVVDVVSVIDAVAVDVVVDDDVVDVVSVIDAVAVDVADNVVDVVSVLDAVADDAVADDFSVATSAVTSLSVPRQGDVGKNSLIDSSVVSRKRGIYVWEVKKGDASVCACCSSYNRFEGRDYCLKGCVCDCYMTWEGRERIKRKVEEERIRRDEDEEDREEGERRRDRRLRKWKYEEERNCDGKSSDGKSRGVYPDVREWGDRDEVRARGREDCQWDLDPDYSEDFWRRFVANIDGTIDTYPLCLRLGCMICDFLQVTRWEKDGTIHRKGRSIARPWVPWRRQFIWIEEFERGVLARLIGGEVTATALGANSIGQS